MREAMLVYNVYPILQYSRTNCFFLFKKQKKKNMHALIIFYL